MHLYGKVPLEPNVLVKVAGPFRVAEAVHACGLLVLVTLCPKEPLGHVQITLSPGLILVVAGTNPVGKLVTVTLAVAPKLENGTTRHDKIAAAAAKKFFNEDFMFVMMSHNKICSRKNLREQLTCCALSTLMSRYG